MKMGLAQINPIVGDLKYNSNKIIEYIDRAKEQDCSMVIFPELALIGYPPRDLLLSHDFVKASQDALESLLPYTQDIGVIIGTISSIQGMDKVYNSAILIYNGSIIGRVDKKCLSEYGVFDESKYFEPAKSLSYLDFQGLKIGLSFGNDININERALHIKKGNGMDNIGELYRESPDIFINIDANPYIYGKKEDKVKAMSYIAEKYNIPFLHVNQVGSNDELIFDGDSKAFDKAGELVLSAEKFEEDFIIFDTDARYKTVPYVKDDISCLHDALILGLRDYCLKTGFKKILLGLSGGVDSALTAYIAAAAVGKGNVLGVSMPSRYSSQHSKDDAKELADRLGIQYRVIPIEDVFKQYIVLMNDSEKTLGDLAEENIQARIRGNILMFISNREGYMLVVPSNKSEIAVGYSTLYGDMSGSLCVLGDVLKTEVYELCRFINRAGEIIPNNIIIKPPSAELSPDQVDQDSLPSYDILDPIIKMYVEENLSVDQIISKGYEHNTVIKIINMIDRSEFKRRQAAPILRSSSQSLDLDRDIPIVNGFRIK